eukprot:TRINITY_DN25495_c0_g1_i1.p1 TRINITY_DN25495_c0_g1~~TRINITY_DN25495_c0_g1_i1.p1  ORF type:complete len:355 (-),score=47.29 TRINITY_DN25495_c0_g1_i1:144-1208(-)
MDDKDKASPSSSSPESSGEDVCDRSPTLGSKHERSDDELDVELGIELELEKTETVAEKPSSWLGLTYVAVATFIFSLMALCVALLAGRLPTFEISFCRGLCQCSLASASLYYLFLQKRKEDPTLKLNLEVFFGPRKHLRYLFIRGASGAGALLLYYYSLSALPLSVAIVISFLVPIFSGVLAALWIGEKYQLLDIVTAIASFVGVILVAEPPFLFHHINSYLPFDPEFGLMNNSDNSSIAVDDDNYLSKFIAIACSLSAAFLTAISFVAVRQIGSAVHSLVLVNWMGAGAVVAALGLIFVKMWRLPPDLSSAIYLAGACLCGFVAQVLLNRGLQLEKVGKAKTIMYIHIIFAVF